MVLLVKVLAQFTSWQVLHLVLPQGAVPVGVGWADVFTSQKVPEFALSSVGKKRWVWYGLPQLLRDM